MKKSQILAALALAFALGVVAPVASTHAAIQSTTVSGTQAEKDEKIAKITEEAKDLVGEADRLENFADYKLLCEKFDCGSKLIEELQKMAKSQLSTFNRGLKNPEATNKYINRVTTIVSAVDFTDAVKDKNKINDSRMKPIAVFSGNYTTLADAYKAVKDVIAVAKDNYKTLVDNYDSNAQVEEAKDMYKNIIWDLNFTANTATDNALYGVGSVNTTSLLSGLNAALNAIFSNATYGIAGYNIAPYLTALRNIDEDKEIEMTGSKDWNAAPGTDIEFAEDINLIIKTAKSMPKYCATCPLLTAYRDAQKIYSNSDQVDYKEAQTFVATLAAAIKDFRNGACNKPSDNNPGTGEGENKPGDDQKDPNAPDTGILADAEANASTTVAMVAGIATALTAAGAGVVAYRNARRSTRK